MKGEIHLLLTRSLRGGAAVLFALFALLACAWLQPTAAYAAEEASQPAVGKTLTANGDGTYNLTLSVAGRSSSSQENSNANVVIIFDTSGSMDEAAYTKRYLPVNDYNTQNRYGLVDGAYVPLTYSYRTGAFYVGGTLQRYDGQRYRLVQQQQGTRMSNAKAATNALIESLLSNNTADHSDAVEISMVNFSSTVNSVTDWTTNEYALVTQVDGYRASGGTNWEAALSRAKALADTKAQAQPDEATYVVFVSDGNPTFRNSRLGGNDWNDTYGVWGTGNSDPNGRNFDAAKAVADGIVGAGYQLYTVNAFGDAENMQNLGGTYQSAEDPAALTAAFNEIVNRITNAVVFSNVKVTDALTELTSTALKADPASFTYTKDGTAWPDAPAATYTDGRVSWDLSRAGQLEHNVIYAVSFRVWPSQEALDLRAELAGGLKSYDDLTADQRAQIVKTADGWGLATNTPTGNDVTYDQVFTRTSKNAPVDDDPQTEGIQNDGYTFTQAADGTWVGTKSVTGTVALSNPDPLPLASAQLPVEKLWKNDVDTRAASEVTLDVTRDGLSYTSVSLDDANSYKETATASAGLMTVTADGSYEVLEAGHDFTVVEPAGFDGGAWEFRAEVVRPMIVNGTPTMLVKTGQETGSYKIGDSWYQAGAAGASLEAQNVRRSSLSLAKLVDDRTGGAAPTDVAFSYAIEFTSPEGAGIVFSVRDANGQPATVETSAKDNGDGTYAIESGSPFVLKLKANWTVVFESLATGTEFSIVETGMPEGFSFEKMEATNGTPTNATDVLQGLKGTIGAADTAYAIASVNSFDSVTLSGDTALKVTKEVTGRPATEAFGFELAAGDDATAVAVKAGTVTMGATTAATGDKMVDGEKQTLNFGDVTFYREGTYTFTVHETNAQAPAGWTYDTDNKTITVTVAKDNGKLKATVEGNNPTVTNAYAVQPTTAQIEVRKDLVASDDETPPDITGKFTFTLQAVDGAPMPADVDDQGVASVTSPAAGTSTKFGAIEYTKPGVYTYLMNETGTVEGVTNDPNGNKRITVDVTDKGDGTLLAVVNGGETIVFTNSYDEAAVVIPVTKVLEVPKGFAGPQSIKGAYTFTFEASSAGAPLPADAVDGKVVKTNPADNGGTELFGPIVLKSEGTYRYKVTESGTVAGVTNDAAAEKTVTVTVAKDDGKLAASWEVTDGTNAAADPNQAVRFTNVYDDITPAKVTIPIAKTVRAADDAVVPAWEYTFTLANADGATVDTQTIAGDRNARSGQGAFKELSFYAPGTYRYKVTESGSVAGITTDSTPVNVTIEVVDAGDGTLTATTNANQGATAAFWNDYETTQLDVAKQWAGDDELTELRPDHVTFRLLEDGVFKGKAIALTSDTGWAGSFFNLPVYSDSAKQQKIDYTIEEEPVAGYTGSYDAKVDVGKITNTIDTGSLKLTKKVTAADGLTAPDATFSFTITLDKKISGVFSGTAFVDGVATVYLRDGESRTFEGLPAGASYTVTENPVDGFRATAEGDTGTIEKGETATAVFTNNYAVTPATATIFAAKNLVVPPGLAGPAADKVKGAFTFTLAAKDGAPLPADGTTVTNPDGTGTAATFGAIAFTAPGTYTYTVTESGSLAGVTNDAAAEKTVTVTVTDNGTGGLVAESSATTDNPVVFTNTYAADPVETTGLIKVQKQLTGRDWMSGDAFAFALAAKDGAPPPAETTVTATGPDAVAFGAITYTKPGAYSYTVSEQAGNIPGVAYNEHEQTVTVLVTDNAEGKLVAQVAYGTDADAAVFENTYTPAAADAAFSFTKALNNADIADGVFNFELSAKDGAPLPATTNAVNDARGTVAFGAITYTKPGTYVYAVKETVDASLPYTYDTQVKTVTVNVVDNPATGTLEATVSYPDGTTFTNTYTATSGETVIEAAKLVNGQAPEASGLFTFTITAQDGGALPAQTTVTNEGGVVAFGPIVYDASIFAGAATEATPADADAANAATTDERAAGAPDVAATAGADDAAAKKETTAGKDVASKPAATESASPSADAAGADDEAAAKAGAADEANANKDADSATSSDEGAAAAKDAKASLLAETADAAEGDASAPAAPLQVGPDGKRYVDYHYTIVEAKGNAAGYTYDPEAKVVTVHVVDNGDGTLTATQTGTAPVFNNTYAAEGTVAITATKVVEGPTQLGNRQFEFGLFEGDTQVATAFNDASGTVTFNVDYKLAAVGDHLYTIREIGPDATGFTMDGSAKTVRVTVTDTGVGTLEAAVTEGAGATFTNIYKPNPTVATITATKVLEGADLTEGAFAFQLADESGAVLQTVANAADGTVAFVVPLTETGVFTYTVTEVYAGQEGMAYSDAALTYTVTVKDAGGMLEAAVTAPDEAVFTNVYTAPPADEEPPAPTVPADTPATPIAGPHAPTPATGGPAATTPTPTTGDEALPFAAGAAALALAGAVLAAIARKKGKNGNK